jgi:DNA-binding transcriptional LysR family regulator
MDQRQFIRIVRNENQPRIGITFKNILKIMVRVQDVLIFVHVVKSGSFSEAARELALTPAVTSAALKRLESTLRTQLLIRSTRSLRLTADGERYLEYAQTALSALEAGGNAIAQDKNQISGAITVSVPSDLGRNLLQPWLDDFLTLHPTVSVQLRISDRVADLYRQPVDVALRYGKPADSALVALPLVPDNPRVLCASPDYFARQGLPQTPAELRHHQCLRRVLGETIHDHWKFTLHGETYSVPVDGIRISDDGDVIKRWAIAGYGLAYKSRIDVLADLRAGRLQVALPAYGTEANPLYMVVAHRVVLSSVVVALRDYLQARLADHLAMN